MNTNRTTKVVGFSVPPTLVREVESLARQERRTKSELFREMVRVYRRYRLQRDRDEERWIQTLIDGTKAEEARKPTAQADLLKESERLARYGAQQGKKLGIKPKDVNRLVHAVRNQQ